MRNEELRQQAREASETAQARAAQQMQKRNEEKQRCESDARGWGGWCRWEAADSNAADVKACASIVSGFSGNLHVSFGPVQIGAGWSPDAKVAHCKDVVAADLGFADFVESPKYLI